LPSSSRSPEETACRPRWPPEQLQHALALRDLTDPEAGSHAIQMLVDVAVDALAQTWRCDVRRERVPRVVALEDNYDRLR